MTKLDVCCGKPLVGTLIFPGAEYFCTVCGNAYGMFGAPNRVDATPEMLALHESLAERFRAVAKDCIPFGAQLRDCPKCCGSEPHHHHATDGEMEASDAAYRALRDESERRRKLAVVE